MTPATGRLIGGTILDLCSGDPESGGGGWSEPYAAAGYTVIRVDIKTGGDARLWPSMTSPEPRHPSGFGDIREYIGQVQGVLAAPVCTVFSGSGALRLRSDDDMREALALVDACIRIVYTVRPKWWALENPVGKLNRWLGDPAYRFQPNEHGDPWTKRTNVWGLFNKPVKCPVPATQGSKVMQLGGKSARTKTLRSITPPGFAQAFYEANP